MTRWPGFQPAVRPMLRVAAIIATVSVLVLAVGVSVASSSGSSSPGVRLVRPALAGGRAIASCTARGLPTLGGRYGNVTAAAPNGDIVGLADDPAGAAQPVLWRAGQPHLIH